MKAQISIDLAMSVGLFLISLALIFSILAMRPETAELVRKSWEAVRLI